MGGGSEARLGLRVRDGSAGCAQARQAVRLDGCHHWPRGPCRTTRKGRGALHAPHRRSAARRSRAVPADLTYPADRRVPGSHGRCRRGCDVARVPSPRRRSACGKSAPRGALPPSSSSTASPPPRPAPHQQPPPSYASTPTPWESPSARKGCGSSGVRVRHWVCVPALGCAGVEVSPEEHPSRASPGWSTMTL